MTIVLFHSCPTNQVFFSFLKNHFCFLRLTIPHGICHSLPARPVLLPGFPPLPWSACRVAGCRHLDRLAYLVYEETCVCICLIFKPECRRVWTSCVLSKYLNGRMRKWGQSCRFVLCAYILLTAVLSLLPKRVIDGLRCLQHKSVCLFGLAALWICCN